MATPRSILVQMALVALLILSFMWFWRPVHGSPVVFAAALIILLLLSHRARDDSLRNLGFRFDTTYDAAKILVPIGVAAVVATLIAGTSLGGRGLPPAQAALPNFAKGMVFGLLQQYLLLAFFYRGIAVLLRGPVAIVATAALFALFHLPNTFLMAVTFAAGLVSVAVYRRSPNLWVSGVVHGLVSYSLYCLLPTSITAGLRVGPEYWGQ